MRNQRQHGSFSIRLLREVRNQLSRDNPEARGYGQVGSDARLRRGHRGTWRNRGQGYRAS